MTIKQALALINTDIESGAFAALAEQFPDEARAVNDAVAPYTLVLETQQGDINDYIPAIIQAAMNWLAVTESARKVMLR